MKKFYILILFAFLSFNALGMTIFIQTPNNGTIALEVEASDPIENVKSKIQEAIGINPDNQILKFNDIILENGNALFDYNIQPASTLQLTVTTLGISDIELSSNKLYIYPNPSRNFIQISGLTISQNYKFYNILGTEISNGTISDDKKIDIQNFTNGLYFLKLDNANAIKFIKE
jgi:hypothetical protein